MTRTIFDYALTDRFILMFLTARGDHTNKLAAFNTVKREDIDPEVAEDGSWMGIPTFITASGVSINLTDDGDFDGDSFKAATFSLIWSVPQDETEIQMLKTRDDGPALVEFRDFRTTHRNGVRTGFSCASWKFAWYQNGVMKRDAGPYAINGTQINLAVDPMGNMSNMSSEKPLQCQFGWDHPGGGNLITTAIDEAIAKNQIVLDRLNPGPSVFENEMEQMIFYATVAA